MDTSIVWLRAILVCALLISCIATVFISYIYIYVPFKTNVESVRSTITRGEASSGTSIHQHIAGLESDANQMKLGLAQKIIGSYGSLQTIRGTSSQNTQTNIDNNNVLVEVEPNCNILSHVATEIKTMQTNFTNAANNVIDSLDTELQKILDDMHAAPLQIRCGTLCFLFHVLNDGDISEWSNINQHNPTYQHFYVTHCNGDGPDSMDYDTGNDSTSLCSFGSVCAAGGC